MMRLKTFILGLVLLLGFSSCVDSQPDLPEGVFALRMGELSTIDGFDLKLTAISDSRCPQGVNCIWAGNALVEVVALDDTLKLCLGDCGRATGNRSFQETDSDTLRQGNEAYLLTLLEVNPYPAHQEKQPEREAKFKLEVL